MGHINFQGLHELLKEGHSIGIPYIPITSKNCDECALGKDHKEIVPKTSTFRASEQNELLHSNMCGPFKHTSLGGSSYFVTFIPGRPRYSFYLKSLGHLRNSKFSSSQLGKHKQTNQDASEWSGKQVLVMSIQKVLWATWNTSLAYNCKHIASKQHGWKDELLNCQLLVDGI